MVFSMPGIVFSLGTFGLEKWRENEGRRLPLLMLDAEVDELAQSGVAEGVGAGARVGEDVNGGGETVEGEVGSAKFSTASEPFVVSRRSATTVDVDRDSVSTGSLMLLVLVDDARSLSGAVTNLTKLAMAR